MGAEVLAELVGVAPAGADDLGLEASLAVCWSCDLGKRSDLCQLQDIPSALEGRSLLTICTSIQQVPFRSRARRLCSMGGGCAGNAPGGWGRGSLLDKAAWRASWGRGCFHTRPGNGEEQGRAFLAEGPASVTV